MRRFRRRPRQITEHPSESCAPAGERKETFHQYLSQLQSAYSVYVPKPTNFFPLFQLILLHSDRSQSPSNTTANLHKIFEKLSGDNQSTLDTSVIDAFDTSVIKEFLHEFKDVESCDEPQEKPDVDSVSEDCLRDAGFNVSVGPVQASASVSTSHASNFEIHLWRLSYGQYGGCHLQRLIWEYAEPIFRLILTCLEPQLPSKLHEKSLLGIVTRRDVRRITLFRTDESEFNAEAGLGMNETLHGVHGKATKSKKVFVEKEGVSGLHFILFPVELHEIYKWRFYLWIDVCDFEEGDNDTGLSRATSWADGKDELNGPANRSRTVTYHGSGNGASHSENAPAVRHRSPARRNYVDVTSPHQTLPFIDIDIKPFLSDFANDQCKLSSYLRMSRGESSNLAKDAVSLLRCALEKCRFESTVRACYDLSGCYREGTGVNVATGVSKLLRCCARSMRLNYDTRWNWLKQLMNEIGARRRVPPERELLLMLLLSRRTLSSIDLETAEYTGAHLVEAGRASELVELLMSPLWTKRQLQVNGLLSLESDYSLAIHALRDGRIDANEDERFETEQVLQLISEAVILSWPYISKNFAEIYFQLHGRLKHHVEKFKGIRDYVNRIEREREGPSALCINSLLEAAGGANTRSCLLDTFVQCMGVMHDGARIACGCHDGRILIVNALRGEVEKEWKAHDDSVLSISVGRQSRLLVSGSRDGSARVWNVDTGRCLTTFRGHTGAVRDVDLIENARRAVSVSDDGTAQIWDMKTGAAVLPSLRGHGGRVYCVAGLNDGVHFVTGGIDKKLRLWNSSIGSQVGAPFEGHTGLVTSVAVSRDDKRIVSSSEDRTVRLWDAASHNQIGDPLLSEQYYYYYSPSIAVGGDGSRIAALGRNRRLHVWDSESKKRICDPLRLSKDYLYVQFISFLERDVIVSCSLDGIVKVRDLRRHKSGTVPVGHAAIVSTVSFTPDGDYVVSGSVDGTLQLWDSRTGNPVGDPLKGHSDSVNDVTVTPNGRYIISVSDNETVRMWNLQKREPLRTFTGHSNLVSCVAVTPQGDKAVTGSWDKTLRVWDLEAMDGSVTVLKGHKNWLMRVFVTDDGLRIISVDDDDNVLVWEIETRRVVNRSKASNARKMSRREVFDRIGEKTIEDDATLSIPLDAKRIWYGDGKDKRVIATMESDIRNWALSPDQKTICVALQSGQMGLLKLLRENFDT